MGKSKKEQPELISCEGKVYFLPIEARDLKGGKKITPFCKVYLDKDKKFQTDVMGKTSDPSWNEGARLIVLNEDVPVSKIRFVIYHKGQLMQDYIGEVSFEVSSLLDGVPREDWFVLKNKKGTKDMGEMHLQIMYLTKGGDMTKEKDEFPYPLQTLLRKESYQAWETLINQDPDINIKDRKGQTPIHVCAELDCIKELEILLNKDADVSIIDNNGQSALHSAALSGSVKAATKLIEKKIKLDLQDEEGRTPLHLAVEKNNVGVVELLLENNATVDLQDKEDNTPLHLAIINHSEECIPHLIAKNSDIYIKNQKSKTCFDLAVDVGSTEKESIQTVFFKSVNVVDEREFKLKKEYKNREIFKGNGLVGEEGWQENNSQISITGEKGAEIFLLMHYDDPISKTTQPMEKCGFIVFKNEQTSYKELSYCHDNLIYGRLEPISITINDESTSFTVIVYSKSISKLSGDYHIVGYSNSNFSFNELPNWPHNHVLDNKWDVDNAGGCIEHDTFPNNPKYQVELPSENVKIMACLSQEKNMGDVQAFSVIPYKYYTGLYIFDKNITIPIESGPIARTIKFKNGRENCVLFEIDGSEHDKIIIIPSTFKPNETSSFTLSIASNKELKVSQLKELPRAEEEPPKKKKRKKKTTK